MAKHSGGTCKKCRRVKEKLLLKGDKCYSAKCPVTKRPYAPGQHGRLPSRISDYAVRLREKQKARQIYGIAERQFESYFDKAEKGKGVTGENLLALLERRLDNVIYRLGFATSRSAARQLVRHGHINVNRKKVNIPSYQVRVGEAISIGEKSKERVKKLIEAASERKPPAWLSLDEGKLEGKIVRVPMREEIDTLIEEHMIIEYYSR